MTVFDNTPVELTELKTSFSFQSDSITKKCTKTFKYPATIDNNPYLQIEITKLSIKSKSKNSYLLITSQTSDTNSFVYIGNNVTCQIANVYYNQATLTLDACDEYDIQFKINVSLESDRIGFNYTSVFGPFDPSGMNLTDADFSGLWFNGDAFVNCNLTNCDFTNARTQFLNFAGCDLTGCKFNTSLSSCDFYGIKPSKIVLDKNAIFPDCISKTENADGTVTIKADSLDTIAWYKSVVNRLLLLNVATGYLLYRQVKSK